MGRKNDDFECAARKRSACKLAQVVTGNTASLAVFYRHEQLAIGNAVVGNLAVGTLLDSIGFGDAQCGSSCPGGLAARLHHAVSGVAKLYVWLPIDRVSTLDGLAGAGALSICAGRDWLNRRTWVLPVGSRIWLAILP